MFINGGPDSDYAGGLEAKQQDAKQVLCVKLFIRQVCIGAEAKELQLCPRQ